VKLADLGAFWEATTGAPIPLGGILAKKDLAPGIAEKVNELIRKSLEYAFQHYPLLPDYVRQHSQEMDEQVMRQHIDLYVNNYSLGLGVDGVTAVKTLLKTWSEINATPPPMSFSVIS